MEEKYIIGIKKCEGHQPEIFDRKKLEEYIKDIYDCCAADGCYDCPFNEANQEYCQPNIIMELYRRLLNAERMLANEGSV